MEGDELGRQIEVKKICVGAPILATQSHLTNPDSPLSKEVVRSTIMVYTQLHQGT